MNRQMVRQVVRQFAVVDGRKASYIRTGIDLDEGADAAPQRTVSPPFIPCNYLRAT